MNYTYCHPASGLCSEMEGHIPSSALLFLKQPQLVVSTYSDGQRCLASEFQPLEEVGTVGPKCTALGLVFRSTLAWLGAHACNEPLTLSQFPGTFPILVSVLNFVLIPETEWPLKSGTRLLENTFGNHCVTWQRKGNHQLVKCWVGCQDFFVFVHRPHPLQRGALICFLFCLLKLFTDFFKK